MKKDLSYQDKLNAIRDFTTLGINSKKYKAKNPNFTRREKWLISYYTNRLKAKGYIEYDKEAGEFTPKVKFVKSRKKRDKYSPRVSGYFVPGADPEDKIIKGKIIKGNYTKQFIPLDFDGLPPNPEDDEFEEIIREVLFNAITPYFEELTIGDYFTIVLLNGWEIGQNKRKKTPKTKRRDGQKLGEDLDGEDKFENLVEKIIELISRMTAKYQRQMNLVKGLYLYKFTNQREPTAKERKISGKRKRKHQR